MSTYILQKDTPGSKAGDKYFFDATEEGYKMDQYATPFFHKSIVENNDEWFKEEKPKDWAVLSLKKGDWGVQTATWTTIYEMHEWIKNGYHIHSVKRLTDNEVFTIGETRVRDCTFLQPSDNGTWIISEITIKDDRLFLNGVNIMNCGKLCDKKLERNQLYTDEEYIKSLHQDIIKLTEERNLWKNKSDYHKGCCNELIKSKESALAEQECRHDEVVKGLKLERDKFRNDNSIHREALAKANNEINKLEKLIESYKYMCRLKNIPIE